MPLEMKLQHPNWHCLDFENKTFILNNVLLIEGGKSTILRIAEIKDNVEDTIEIDLSHLDISTKLKYVPVKNDEEIIHSNLYWLFNDKKPTVKIYSYH
jgi:hypothetical protein